MPTNRVACAVEVTPKKSFAAALDWPGWCRPGRDADAAIAALAEYADRYRPVAEAAGLRLPAPFALEEVERLPGGSTTAFGAPEVTFAADREPVTAEDGARLSSLVVAAWGVFDAVVASSPAELRKGPRGGGRDRDQMVDHVLGAEVAYASKIGVKVKQPALGDLAAIDEVRMAIAAVLNQPSDGGPLRPNGWTARYAARRIAWHLLDHAWEMEDRRP